MASGYAIRESLIVSSAHLFEGERPYAEVKGEFAGLATTPSRVGMDRQTLAPVDDWLGLVVLNPHVAFAPNRVDTGHRPQRGEKVYFGGYLTVESPTMRPADFYKLDPVIIEGESLGGPSTRAGYEGLWWVRVPSGSYEGCSGGPAAYMDDEGALHVWGTLVRGGLIPDGMFRCWAVGIAPLPPEAVTTKTWRAYTDFPPGTRPQRQDLKKQLNAKTTKRGTISAQSRARE